MSSLNYCIKLICDLFGKLNGLKLVSTNDVNHIRSIKQFAIKTWGMRTITYEAKKEHSKQMI